MLTADDLRAIPLFSALAEIDLGRLAQTAADLHLGAGEFAVHEGGERALYAVISGKVQVVKLVDGIERTLGWRVPGAIFGEVLSLLERRFRVPIGRLNLRASCALTRSNTTLSRPLRRISP